MRHALYSGFLAMALLTPWSSIPAMASPQDRVLTVEDFETQKVYSPYVGRVYPDRVLFGDTHFHTNLSFDAGLVGTTLGVNEGYRFARGEKVISNSGQIGRAHV